MEKSITYIDADGTSKSISEGECTVVTAETTTWGDGFYYVASNVTIPNTVSVKGDVTLILGEGVTLTVKPKDATDFTPLDPADTGIFVDTGKTLTVTAQSLGTKMGTLSVTGAQGYNGTKGSDGNSLFANGCAGEMGCNGGMGIYGNMVVNSGNITVTGGDGGKGGDGGNGYENGKGGDGSSGGTAGSGISGNLTVNNGSVTVTGGVSGQGGEGGSGAGPGNGGNGGDAVLGRNGISGNLTVNNGSVTITGGAGGAGNSGGTGNIVGKSSVGVAGGAGIKGDLIANGGDITINGGVGGSGIDSISGAGTAAGAGGSGVEGVLTVNGGNITLNGGAGGNGGNGGVSAFDGFNGGMGGGGGVGFMLDQLTVNDGTLTVNGGNGGVGGNGGNKGSKSNGSGAYGGSGGIGIFYNGPIEVELTGGTVEVTGGNGGNGGNSGGTDGKAGYGGNAGSGISSKYDSSLEVDGASLTVTGGTGGKGGKGDPIMPGVSTDGAGGLGLSGSTSTVNIKSGTFIASGKGDKAAINANTIYVDGDMILKAGAVEASATEISHTSTQNLSGSLSGKVYVLAEMPPTPPISYELSKSVSTTYDGETYSVSVIVTDPAKGATVYYSIDGQQSWTEGSSYSLTDAGSATVCFKIEAEDYTTTITEELTITINQATLTVNGTTVDNKEYDGTIAADVFAGHLEGVIGLDDVSIDTTTGTFDNKNAGTDKNVTVSYTLAGEQAGNYKIAAENKTASITKKEVTVTGSTVSTREYDGTTTATIGNSTLDGKIDGDDLTLDATGDFDNMYAGTSKDVTVAYTISGNDAVNYNLTTVSEILKGEIEKKKISVSGTTVAPSKVYDGNTNAEVTAGTLQDVVGIDDVTLDTATGTYVDKNAGTGKEVTVSYSLKGADASNYTIADEDFTADIDKRKITLTSGDATQVYDGTPLTKEVVNVTKGEFVSGEGFDYSDFASQTEVGSAWNAFEYKAQEGTDEANYDISVIPGSLIVTATESEVKDDTDTLIVPDSQTQEVVCFNIINAFGDAKVQNDSDVNVSVGKVIATGTVTVENNGDGTVSALGVGGTGDVEIFNHGKGRIEVTDELASSGDMEIKNDTTEGGSIVIGGDENMVIGGLNIFNAYGNTINGGGSAETEDEVAAKISVTGADGVTITNEGHINMDLTANKSNVKITNGAPNTLIGAYTGKNVDVINAADGAAENVTLLAAGDASNGGVVKLTGDDGSIFRGDNKITALGNLSKIEFAGTNTFTGKLTANAMFISGTDAVIKLNDVEAEFNSSNFAPTMEISGTSKVTAYMHNKVILKDGVVLSALNSSGATIEGDATLKDAAQIKLKGDQTIATGKTVTVTGTDSELSLESGKTLTNNGTINFGEGSWFIGASDATFVNAGIVNLGVDSSFDMLTVTNSSTINLKGGNIGSSSAITNSGTLNWDLSEGNCTKIDWSKLTNNQGSKLTITVNAADEIGASYTIAKNAVQATGTEFSLTGIGTKEETISVGSEVAYGKYFYKLGLDSNNLVFTADRYAAPALTVTTEDKWFKQGDTVTIAGTVEDYIGCGLKSFVLTGLGEEPIPVTFTKRTDSNIYDWSYTYSGDDTKGTLLTFSATDKSETPLVGTAEYTLKVDKTKPEISVEMTAGTTTYVEGTWTNQNVDVEATFTDVTSGIDGNKSDSYMLNKESTTTDGTLVIFNTKDIAGNEQTKNVVVKIDKTDPVIGGVTVDSFAGDSRYVDGSKVWFKQGDETAVLNVDITDAKSGLKEADFNGAKYDGSKFALATDAAVSAIITAEDNAGNVSKSDAISYYVDGTGPSISVSHVLDLPDYTWQVDVTAVIEDNEGGSGLKSAQYSFDGETWYDYEGTFTVTENCDITVKAKDNVGNETTVVHTVSNIDTVPPVVTITADTVTIKDKVLFSVNATDSYTNVTKLEYSIDDGENWTECTIAKDKKSVDVELTAKVNNTTYAFRAYDQANNVCEWETVTFNNIYENDADDVEILDEKLIIDKQIHDNVDMSEDAELIISASGDLDAETLSMNGGDKLTNNGAASVRNLKISGKGNEIVGEVDDISSVTLGADSEMALDKDLYDELVKNASFTSGEGTLDVAVSDGNDLDMADIKDLLKKENLNSVKFNQDLNGIDKLTVENVKLIGFDNGYGTDKSDKITVKKNEEVTLGNEGGCIDLLKGDNVVKVEKNASLTLNSDLVNVSTVQSNNGMKAKQEGSKISVQQFTGIELQDISFSEDRVGKLKIGSYSHAKAGNVTGGEKKSDEISVGANSDLEAGDITDISNIKLTSGSLYKMISTNKVKTRGITSAAFGDISVKAGKMTVKVGNFAEFEAGAIVSDATDDKITIGSDSKFAAESIDLGTGKNSIKVGARNEAVISGAVSGVKTLTVAPGTYDQAKDVTSWTSFSAGSLAGTKNADTFSFGNYTSTAIAGAVSMGSGSDKLSTGKCAQFTAGNISGAETISFGAYSITAVGNISKVNSLTVKNGNDSQFAQFEAGAVTGTTGKDKFSFGNYNDVELAGIDMGGADDKLTIGDYSNVNISGLLDFGDGEKDSLTIGKGATLNVGELDVESLDRLTIGKDALLCIADAGDLAEAQAKWSKYSAQIVALSC